MLSRFTISCFLLVVALLTACSPPMSADELITRARDAMSSGDLGAAEVDLKRILQDAPDDAQARALYGEIYRRRINPSAALVEFERSLAAAESPETRLLFAQTLVDAGQSAELLSAADAGDFDSLSDSAVFQAVLSRAHLAQSEVELARSALERSAGSDDAYVVVTRAMLALQADRATERAIEILENLTQRTTDYAEAWSFLGALTALSGDPESAEQHLAKAVRLNPYRIKDRLTRVELLVRLDSREAADQQLSYLESVMPDLPTVIYLRGQLLYNAREYRDALDAFNRVLSIDPDNPGALLLAATTNVQQGNLATAQRQLTQFLRRQPDHLQANIQLANVYRQLGEPERSERVARDILEENPMDVRALGLLAVALAAQSKDVESAEVYAQIAELQPESVAPRIAMASQQLASGNSQAAIAQLESAVALDPANATAREALIKAHLQTGDFPAAVSAAQAYLDSAPGSVRAVVFMGRVRLQEGRNDDALALFNEALELDPGNPAASSGLAALAMLDNDADRARAVMQDVLEAHPGHLATSMNLARLLQAEGEQERMIDVLEAAVEANPDAAPPRLAAARYRLKEGNPRTAIEMMEPLAESASTDYRVAEVLTLAYIDSGQADRAESTSRALLELKPDDAGAMVLAARVAMARGRPQRAEPLLRDALELAPENARLRGILIESLIAQRKFELAEAEISRLPKEIQSQAPMLSIRGRIALTTGNPGAAKQYFTDAFAADETNLRLIELNTARWALNEKDAVLASYREWLKVNRDDLLVRNELATRLLVNEDYAQARAEFQLLLDAKPEDPVILNNLAWLSREDDNAAALAYIARAEELVPNSAALKDTRAMVELAGGNSEEALAVIDVALQLDEGNPEMRVNRARILLALGRRDEASAELRDVLAGAPFPNRDEAEALLDSL